MKTRRIDVWEDEPLSVGNSAQETSAERSAVRTESKSPTVVATDDEDLFKKEYDAIAAIVDAVSDDGIVEGKVAVETLSKPTENNDDVSYAIVAEDYDTLKSIGATSKNFYRGSSYDILSEEGELRAAAFVFHATSGNVQTLAYLVKDVINVTGYEAELSHRALSHIKSVASSHGFQRATVSYDGQGKFLDIYLPYMKPYLTLMSKLSASPSRSSGESGEKKYRLGIARLMDLTHLAEATLPDFVPVLKLSQSARQILVKPIEGFDGTVNSLRDVSVGELNIVAANPVSYKEKQKKNPQTMQQKLESFGISTLYDVLMMVPIRYIDKSKPQNIDDIILESSATIAATIADIDVVENRSRQGNKPGWIEFILETETGQRISAVFFRQQWLSKKFGVGTEVMVTGKLSFWKGELGVYGKSIENLEESSIVPVLPIYSQSQSKGITSAFLLSIVRELLTRMGVLTSPSYWNSLEDDRQYTRNFVELHTPESLESTREARHNFAMHELTMMQVLVQSFAEEEAGAQGLVLDGCHDEESPLYGLQDSAVKSLPFTMTNSQVEAVASINSEMAQKSPMSTLLSADVGAGKTLVSQLAALKAVESGYQAIIIANTDVLARQIHKSTQSLLESFDNDVSLELLVDSLKAGETKAVKKRIASGEASIIIGTTSLLSKTVEFNNLGFVCIDEQQKFGTAQRTEILDRRHDDAKPDFMMQSATPIPRSIAQVVYGDVTLVELKDKPVGRQPIETVWVKQSPREVCSQGFHEMWGDVLHEIEKGHQIFIVAPMVNEGDPLDEVSSVDATYKQLSESILSSVNVGTMHGQMSHDRQRQAMDAFRNKELDVLIASTVVEVGVDIPDATRMIILSANRMGASSLHQIRGRVGRNSMRNKCYLVAPDDNEKSNIRLQTMVDTNDGFEVASVDLDARGEGTLFNSSQAGSSGMVFASLRTNKQDIDAAAQAARKILAGPHRQEAIDDAKIMFDVSHDGRMN